MAVEKRRSSASYFTLVLDGVDCGFVRSAEGGDASAEVISEAMGSDRIVRKHLGSVKYNDIRLHIDLTMAQPIYEWIVASWNAASQRKNGVIVFYGSDLKARSRLEFFNALIVETSIPALDSSTKDSGYLTLKLAPESTGYSSASGKAATRPATGKQKQWLPANFRLEIDGLDCSKVSRIDPFAVSQTIATDQLGDQRDHQREPARLEFPNLRITLAESSAQSWIDWHADFVIKGNNLPEQEKSGALVFLAPNLKTELGRVNFFNLGIFRLARGLVNPAADAIRRVTAELYCERLAFALTGAALSSATD